MKVQIEGNLYLESDSHNYLVKEYADSYDKEGRQNVKFTRYFDKLGNALAYLMDLEVKKSTADTLRALRIDVLAARDKIKGLVGV